MAADRQNMAKPTEDAQLRKQVQEADADLHKKASKGGISRAARRMVKEWTASAHSLRSSEQAHDTHLARAHAARIAHEAARDGTLHGTEHDEISAELARYDEPFESSRDSVLRSQQTERQQSLARSRAEERSVAAERRRRASLLHAAERREDKKAEEELSSYDLAPENGSNASGKSREELDIRAARATERRQALADKHAWARASRAERRLEEGRAHGARAAEGHGSARDFRTPAASAPAHAHEAAQQSAGGKHAEARGASAGCYLSTGREVPCDKLAKLGALMKSIYGTGVKDVELVSRSHKWDPTNVFASQAAARRAAAAAAQRRRESRGESSLGKLLHAQNVAAANPAGRAGRTKGSLKKLSDSLEDVLGW